MHKICNRALLDVVKREYPDVISKIKDDFFKKLPEEIISDLSLVPTIFNRIKSLCEFQSKPFTDWIGTKKAVHDRQLAVSVLLLLYNPYRLFNLVEREHLGLVGQLHKITGLSRAVLSQTINTSISRFKLYNDFNTEVYKFYNIINNEYNPITNGKEN